MTKCKVCRSEFVKRSMTHKCCTPACAEQWVAKENARKEARKARDERRQDSAARLKLKTHRQWLNEAQNAFNAWVRARDVRRPCISCGRQHDGQWHAGHYLSVGARRELRFEPDNVWKQCQPCNVSLHGNLIRYRAALVELLGVDRVEWLEGPHEPRKYTIDELKAMKADYTRRAREFERMRDNMDSEVMQ